MARYADLVRPVANGHPEGFCKLIVETRWRQIVGAHVLGEYSTEVIQMVAACMAAGMRVKEVAELQPAFLHRGRRHGRTYAGARARRPPDFQQAIRITMVEPVEVVTDKAATCPILLEELLPAAWHRTDQHANNHVEADHGRLKARLRSMHGPSA